MNRYQFPTIVAQIETQIIVSSIVLPFPFLQACSLQIRRGDLPGKTLGIEGIVQVACRVQDADDVDPAISRAIKDQMVLETLNPPDA